MTTVDITASPYFAVGDGTTNNAAAFAAFAADYQGQTVTLTIPAGDFHVSSGYQALFDGIVNLTVNGAGAGLTTISGSTYGLGAASLYQDDAHSARTVTVVAGASSVTLLTPAQAARFTVGQWALMTGLALQGSGYPSNHHYFEFVRVTGISGATVSFSAPLRNSYLSTWPLYFAGSAFEIDCGGPATLYALHPSWNCTHAYNSLTVTQTAQTNANGRAITFNNCTFTGALGPIPSVNKSWTLTGCTGSGCTMEVDKYVETLTLDGGTSYGGVQVQSSSVDLLVMTDVTLSGTLDGTPKRTQLTRCTIAGLKTGATQYGRSDELVATDCAIATLYGGSYTWRGPSNNGIAPIFSAGLITIPRTGDNTADALAASWAVPDTSILWVDDSAYKLGVARVQTVTADNSNIYVTVNANTLPTANTGTKIYVHVHDMPVVTFTNCTGDVNVVGMSGAPARRPIYSWQRHTYTSGACGGTTQSPFVMWGNASSISLNVTHPYAGAGGLTFNLSAGNSWWVGKSDNTYVQWNADASGPAVNAKIAGERVIARSGVTSTQSGDAGLSLPDSTRAWFSGQANFDGAQYSADVSGTDAAVSVTVTFATEQGVQDPSPPLSPPTEAVPPPSQAGSMTLWDDLAGDVVGILFDSFGVAATYTAPAGSPVACTVIIDLREAGQEAGQMRPRTGQATLQVRALEVAVPVNGGVFTVGATVYTVQDRPMLDDPDGLVWTMWVVR